MRIGCNLLWLVPGRVGGSEEATVALLREIAAQKPEGMDYVVYALDDFGATYPDIAELFPMRLAALTGRLKPLRVVAENTWLAAETRKERLDLVHHMNAVLPMVRRSPGILQPRQPQVRAQPRLGFELFRVVIECFNNVCAVVYFVAESSQKFE